MAISKTFKGKAIYCPSGKAGEYSYWACNLYKGCSGQCSYCYLKKGITAKVLGGNRPVLKSCLKNEEQAIEIFLKELRQNFLELKKYGLFFSFTSDFLPETSALLKKCINICTENNIPVKILTKQTEWITVKWLDYILNDKVAFGFTLTGHDELEPNCASNLNRIYQMKQCHTLGFKTFASIEPIIDLNSSLQMIIQTLGYCDLYKIGLESGKKYNKKELLEFFWNVNSFNRKVYWKDSLLKTLGIKRCELGINCVERNYNIFN